MRVLVLLFTSLFAIPLARQGSLDAALLARLQVVGVTLDFLDDVLLLDLPLETAKRILKRLAFLYTNFGQKLSTSKPARGLSYDTRNLSGMVLKGATGIVLECG
jgi:hypothetical protein